ncbi:ATP-dependent DNA helicase PIF1 [Trifolium medium]|uniref:ATP-dependent DNA helicase PIF1 n=1 Tax=Trifolium medium TaxID=97028 RepID=A0A392PIP2_9FABA|nr:ATP-dependent DNA helicase PIF1 [Trifolium medium]
MQLWRSSDKNDTSKPVDEIKQYYDCRYVSPCEAVWRILAFDIHQKWPPVLKLTFHLADEQSILFEECDDIGSVVMRNEDRNTMFLAWFDANRQYPEGRDLTYVEFPSKFVYHKDQRMWKPRQQGQQVGRLQYIPPGVGGMWCPEFTR